MKPTIPSFTAPLWKYPGESGWYFVTVPDEHAPPIAGPWGRAPVLARVDGVEWATSVWRDTRHGWLLAVPAKIRRNRVEGTIVHVSIGPDPARPLVV